LPGPKQPASQAGQQQKKSESPTKATEDAVSAYYSGWMSALFPHAAPALDANPQVPAPAKTVALSSAMPREASETALQASESVISSAKSAPGSPFVPAKLPGAGDGTESHPLPGAAQALPSLPSTEPTRMTSGQKPAGLSGKAQAAGVSPPQNPSPTPQVALTSPANAASEGPGTILGTTTAAIEGVEKIAAQGARTAGPASATIRGPDKKILSPDSKQVTNHNDNLGTTVAKVSPSMPTASQTERQPTAMLASAPASGIAAAAKNASADPQAATTQMGVAQRAVEAALSSAEIFNSGAHKAVNLQFSVGNTDLSLTVQMRNGEIHTTFSTDSADLRSDLAHAWQSATPTSGGSLRLADPVFTSPGSADGGSAFQQRGDQSNAESAQQSQGGSTSNASAAPVSANAGSTDESPASLATSLHLQAFA
jgi:hypothetical protein